MLLELLDRHEQLLLEAIGETEVRHIADNLVAVALSPIEHVATERVTCDELTIVHFSDGNGLVLARANRQLNKALVAHLELSLATIGHDVGEPEV